MARTTSICISEPLEAFVAHLVDSGRYGSTSEVVRSALRLLERQEHHTEALRQAVKLGFDSGVSNRTLRDIAEDVKRRHFGV